MQPKTTANEQMSGNPAPKLLIVEDHDVIAKALLLALQREGIGSDAVDYASSAETAMRWLIRKDYAVLLVDLILPGQSGIDLLAQFSRDREKTISSKVIVMTASSSPVLARLDRAIVHAIFFKPLDFPGVAAYIAALCRSSAGKS